jgi:predicted transcriptional regulator
LANSSLPLEIKTLLTECIETVSQLEALFAFYKNPLNKWTVASLSKELRSNETQAANLILHLERNGFIKKEDSAEIYSYSPRDPLLAKNVELLHETFQQRSVAVIAFLYEKPKDKLKGFADAFKFKKD